MATFQSKRVSTYWAVVLLAAEDAGVEFRLNSGQRTIAEQWDLYDKYLDGTGNLAAYPSRTAPHIRTGKQAHAIDVDSWRDGENALQRWLRAEGVSAQNTVSGEAWHLEVSERGLTTLYKRYRGSHGYPNPARRWIREYDRLKRQNRDRSRRSVLRRVMKQERKKYWGKPSQAGVYAALLRRSR